MFENENVVNDTQEQVVDVQETVEETSEVAEVETEAEEVANPQTETETTKEQTPEENSKFAEFRRAKEQAEREAQQLKEKTESFIKKLNEYGFQGKSPDEIQAEIEAQMQGIELEEYLKNQQIEKSKIDELIQNDPRILEAEKLKQQIALENDLKAVKEAYPDVKANSVFELGEKFIELMKTGLVDPVTAYEVQLRFNEKNTKSVPPKIGAVNEKVTVDKEFYTPEEVDRLTEQDYDKDPTLFEKVRRSMLKWK